MRIAVLIEEKCKPKSEAYDYLKKWAGSCGAECIQMNGDKFKILESACPPCFVRARHCPDGALQGGGFETLLPRAELLD